MKNSQSFTSATHICILQKWISDGRNRIIHGSKRIRATLPLRKNRALCIANNTLEDVVF
ncbi:MAG: hypothetical protein ACRCTF_07360 [Bacteroidales bacterium]